MAGFNWVCQDMLGFMRTCAHKNGQGSKKHDTSSQSRTYDRFRPIGGRIRQMGHAHPKCGIVRNRRRITVYGDNLGYNRRIGRIRDQPDISRHRRKSYSILPRSGIWRKSLKSDKCVQVRINPNMCGYVAFMVLCHDIGWHRQLC